MEEQEPLTYPYLPTLTYSGEARSFVPIYLTYLTLPTMEKHVVECVLYLVVLCVLYSAVQFMLGTLRARLVLCSTPVLYLG